MGLFAKSQSVREVTAHLMRCLRHNECQSFYTDLARLYGKYGSQLEFSLDSDLRRLELSVAIAGKNDPLKISVREYRMAEEDQREFIVLDGVETSWAWLNLILRGSGLSSKKLPLSTDQATLLRAALFPDTDL